MAKKETTLTCTFFVGSRPVDKLTPEQLDKISERFGEALSLYYSNHINEYAKIKLTGNAE